VSERALITSADGRHLNLDRALPDTAASQPAPSGERGAASPVPADRILTAAEMQDVERRNIIRALEVAGWKISGRGGAAEQLGLNPNTLSSRMKVLGIARHRGRSDLRTVGSARDDS
jgi:transcriptional regulator with GAF, ATPase, and Fis domain